MKEDAAAVPAVGPRASSPTECMGHEALQALLAFSALHEQIRNRRAKQANNGSDPADDWQLEQFVLDEVLQLVAERALVITGADGVAVALAQDDAIVCRASAGSIVPDPGVRLDPNSGFSGECLVSGRIVRCDDIDTDPRVNLEACRRLGVRSMLAVPLSDANAADAVAIVYIVSAFPGEERGRGEATAGEMRRLFPHACIVTVFLPGMLLQPEPAIDSARGADKAASSLSHAVQICLDLHREPTQT